MSVFPKAKTNLNDDGFVYLAKTSRGYKIGRTKDIKARFKTLKTETGAVPELIHFHDCDYNECLIEYVFLQEHKEKLVYGREYFDLNNEDIETFKKKTSYLRVKAKAIEIEDKRHKRYLETVSKPLTRLIKKKISLLNQIRDIEYSIDFEIKRFKDKPYVKEEELFLFALNKFK